MIGVGKSALSRSLGGRLQWPVVDKDDYPDVLPRHLGSAAYECTFSATQSLLAQGFSVICDSPLRGEIGYERAKALAAGAGADLRVVVCTLSDTSLWQTRLETRTRRPTHILETWQALLTYRQDAEADFNYLVSDPTLQLDMAEPLETLCQHTTNWLKDLSAKENTR